jgi:peptide deformylase
MARDACSRDGVNAMRSPAASASRLRLVKPLRIAYLAAMAVRPILIHPDPRLRKVAEPVAAIDDGLRALASDMLQTMYEAPGVGLAATQLGVIKRVFVMDCAAQDEPKQPIVLVNPEILWKSDETVMSEEGCLSIPDVYDDVVRPARVRLRWTGLDGLVQEREFEGRWAVCAQHELDHLNGRLFIDYLSGVKRAMITSRMKKLKREKARA